MISAVVAKNLLHNLKEILNNLLMLLSPINLIPYKVMQMEWYIVCHEFIIRMEFRFTGI